MSTTANHVPWRALMANVAMLQSVLGEAEPRLNELNLDHKTVFMLALLESHPHPAQLADALVMPRPTITSLIKRAESHRLLKREGVADDLRKFRLALTPVGRRMLKKTSKILNEIFAARLLRLDSAELSQFFRLFEKLNRPLD